MTVTVVDNLKGDWRRVYLGKELIAENHPMRINLLTVLRAVAREHGFTLAHKTVDDFNLLEEAGGVAQS